ncbi:hypothetical protein HG535_0A07320 [Zygotorulaspora mrakii]|uniref:Major facilitator superfamily (MFS) profile domain-containing protein n=1 Tax=Zygotorulaspora mrakii TaxID=42260 RepID=A0A7H9AWK3_ZYGMR|nr:uncharacterized protein HG535_0A07320 [Zygotorulaspora mrakii]QLG70790.1 hypothetical protein HG535_0A07320 [Zygotorulaspora mrakii]
MTGSNECFGGVDEQSRSRGQFNMDSNSIYRSDSMSSHRAPPQTVEAVTCGNDDRVECREATVEGATAEHDTNSDGHPYRGYMIILAGFAANFVVFGFAFTYGVFQDFYLSADGPLHGKSPSSVSIIGTLATGLTYLLTFMNNAVLRYLSIRQVMIAGSLLMSMGLVCASFASEIWHFALTQGVMFGIGGAMTYLPPVIHAPPYFKTHRGTAMGLLFSGTGIGGLVLAPLTRFLITRIGWNWALRVCGMISFIFLVPTSLLVHPHQSTLSVHESDKLRIIPLNSKLFTNRKFIIHMAGAAFQSAGYLIPGYYMSSFGQTLGFSYNEGSVLIGINNAVNAASKIVVGYSSDKFGRFNMLVLCCVLSSLTVLGLWLTSTRGTFISFVVLYGAVSGPIISLLPTCLVELFGLQNYQSSTWFLYFCRGAGTFLGSPIAGLFIRNGALVPRDYRNTILYNAALFLANSSCFIFVRTLVALDNNWKLKQ